MRRRRFQGSALARGAAAVAAALVLTSCSSGSPSAGPSPSASPSPSTGPISFVVYGPAPVVSAYKSIASAFDAQHPDSPVRVKAYATHDEAMAAVTRDQNDGRAPDVFQAESTDLTSLVAAKEVRRVDDLLTAREVDFGDGYSRTGLEAFSSDAALQCMPTEVSPLVVYYNTRLIDLTEATDPGRRQVSQTSGWTFEEFTKVAGLAETPMVRGFDIAPDVSQVAPFIWSGGGDLVDDPDNPTTLVLSQDSSQTALQELLLATRNPSLTFTQAQLRKKSALDRFRAGQLGMVLGYRDLLPELRRQQGLNFDVMPLPRLGSAATDLQMRGLCISATSKHVEAAADFITAAISAKSQSALAATGYVMPANLEALNSDSFTQRGQRPLHPEVFQREVRHGQPMPSSQYWPQVVQAADQTLTQLFYDPGSATTADRLAALDERSRLIFNPDATPSPSPSQSASPSSTSSPSPSASTSSP